MTLKSTDRSAVSVSVKNVFKQFGSQVVLKNISLDVTAEEIFVIMGPSGSGKSVLLKSIIGLDKPSKGQIFINDSDAMDPKTHSKYLTSIVFQSGALFNSLNVFDNLALYPQEHGIYKNQKDLKDAVMDILQKLSLEKAAAKYPSELSGGMCKRVAIARALITKPQLLLFDEPTSELDPGTAADIAEVIGTLKEIFHVTSIVVSHDRDLAFAIGDTIAVLMNGSVKAIGSAQEIRNNQDPDVVSFLNPKIDIKNPRFKTNKH